MNHIKFRIKSRQTGTDSTRLQSASIARLRSDWLAMGYDLPLILHALSSPGWQDIEASGPFILDTANLDSERWLLG